MPWKKACFIDIRADSKHITQVLPLELHVSAMVLLCLRKPTENNKIRERGTGSHPTRYGKVKGS